MEDMKVVNKYPVLTDVKEIDSNSILLTFSRHQYFDLKEDVYELTIFGNNVAKYIDHIKEYNLHTETAIVDKINELEFCVGNIHESPDWGDWNVSLYMAFERYSGRFITKTQEDWENELMYLISDQARTRAFQSVSDPAFRNQKAEEVKGMIASNQIEHSTKLILNNLLDKIRNLDDGIFYDVFVNGSKINWRK